ncbi:hypothetical protein DL98DRAFT_572946 [Cadophora sp. DSE1049]|nr:hypothetical protein DL98DRAFT_572946 [Cadophora sp. DSE1049]
MDLSKESQNCPGAVRSTLTDPSEAVDTMVPNGPSDIEDAQLLELAIRTPLPWMTYYEEELLHRLKCVTASSLTCFVGKPIEIIGVYNEEDWEITQYGWIYDDDGQPCLADPYDTHEEYIGWPEAPSPPNIPRIFHKFSDLPTEIRQVIWGHCLPDPRTLILCATNQKGAFYEEEDTQIIWFEELVMTTSAFSRDSWTMVQVCRESWGVFMKGYQYLRLLGPNISGLWGEDTLEYSDLRDVPQILFRNSLIDVKRDTILIQANEMLALNRSPCWLDFSSVRNLTLLSSTSNSNNPLPTPTLFSTPESVWHFIQDFPKLEAFCVVLGPRGISSDDAQLPSSFIEIGDNFTSLKLGHPHHAWTIDSRENGIKC